MEYHIYESEYQSNQIKQLLRFAFKWSVQYCLVFSHLILWHIQIFPEKDFVYLILLFALLNMTIF